MHNLGFRMYDLGFRVHNLGFRMYGLGFRVHNLGFLIERSHGLKA